MMKKNLVVFSTVFLASGIHADSKRIVDCRLVTSKTTECKTYTSKFMFSSKLSPTAPGHELIISKTLPARPKPRHVKIVSVEDMIEEHLNILEPVRYRGSQPSPLIDIEEERQKLRAEKIAAEKIAAEKAEKEEARKLAEAAEALEKKKALEKEKLAAEQELKRQLEEAEIRQKMVEKELEEELKKEALAQEEKKKEEEAAKKKLAEEKERIEKESKKNAKYIVQKGDSLNLIAKRFKLKTKQIQAENTALKDKTTIRIGQKLAIPLSQKEVDSIVDKLKSKKGKKSEKSTLSRQLEKKYSYLNKKTRKKVLNDYDNKLIKVTKGKHKLRVQATAYTSHKGQTDKTPFLAAWNNRIRPGMKVIAVSRDLIRKHGLGNGKRVKIQGLSGTYIVRDKMNKRLSRHIDIYMGTDRRKALRWGRRRVVIYW